MKMKYYLVYLIILNFLLIKVGKIKKNDSNSSWAFEVVNSPLIIDKTQDYIYQIKNIIYLN